MPRERLRARFSQREFYGDEVLVLEGVSKGFGDRTLFSDVSLTVEPGERIALIGDNGAGKSTLLKIIMGEIQPDAGWIFLGPAVKKAYLPQTVKFENPARSVLDTMIYEGNCSHQSARNRLAAFKFAGEDVFKPVSALSGGELSRLRLCILMRDEINFLILDEPTNHLDLASREWIEEALSEYGETLLFVSHDRYFIDRFATRIWELAGGKITDFKGGFSEYRQFKERQAALQQIEKSAPKKSEPGPKRRSRETPCGLNGRCQSWSGKSKAGGRNGRTGRPCSGARLRLSETAGNRRTQVRLGGGAGAVLSVGRAVRFHNLNRRQVHHGFRRQQIKKRAVGYRRSRMFRSGFVFRPHRIRLFGLCACRIGVLVLIFRLLRRPGARSCAGF